MTLVELSQLLDLPPRVIRYLISEGIMPKAPLGRGANGYGDAHVRVGTEYRRLLDRTDMSAQAIKVAMRAFVASIFRDDMIELRTVDADALAQASDEDLDALLGRIGTALRKARDEARNEGGE